MLRIRDAQLDRLAADYRRNQVLAEATARDPDALIRVQPNRLSELVDAILQLGSAADISLPADLAGLLLIALRRGTGVFDTPSVRAILDDESLLGAEKVHAITSAQSR